MLEQNGRIYETFLFTQNRLPYLGPISESYRKNISGAVTRCYKTVNPRVVFTSRAILPSSSKDAIPSHKRSQLIYHFECSCESSYVGMTSQRLESRIAQHVPKKIEKCLGAPLEENATTSTASAIAEHLLKKPDCGAKYNRNMFRVISHGRSEFDFKVLESIHSMSKDPI